MCPRIACRVRSRSVWELHGIQGMFGHAAVCGPYFTMSPSGGLKGQLQAAPGRVPQPHR